MSPSTPHADFGSSSGSEVAAEPGWYFDRGVHGPRLERALLLLGVLERGFLREIGRAADLLEIGAALRGVVPVEHPERKIVDVGGDAEAENQHEKAVPKTAKDRRIGSRRSSSASRMQ